MYSISSSPGMRRARPTVVNGLVQAGVHTAVWDGRDDHGTSVRAGAYFVRLVSGAQSTSRKLLLRQ